MSSLRRLQKSEKPSANVAVCVRVRPLSYEEKKDGRCLKSSVQSKTLTVKGKVFGPFDDVFDEQSTQPDIYEQTVRQNVELVMRGYNCTLFAYGQTGTGKTYTMEGSAQAAYTGNWRSDPHLGIIPRAVEHIFDTLESEGAEEWCMRVSYLELYNEELFDLLSPHADDNTRLRIFDDPSKKGAVVVSGMEEVSVTSRAEVFKCLQRGAERKTMAETKLNSRSSRSHCLFIINLIIREATRDGEEVVRKGKLNLVDLAGSESIGRSGAAGQRAKEAGSINQSLLTLGRCITALTSNAGHVPYRESKLTRMLQDALGGSTVTTIIATVSSSNAAHEETLSTLEYASRAKNIKNHPEMNEKCSRKAALKEMSEVIERLHRDLRNAREKNGIYLSEESFVGMEEKIKQQQANIEELEEQLSAMFTKLQNLLSDLSMLDEQYRMLFERKCQVENRLTQRVDEIDALKKAACEAEKREKALSSSIGLLHDAAIRIRYQGTEVQRTAVVATEDVAALWAKIDAVVELATHNTREAEHMTTSALQNVKDVNQTSTTAIQKTIKTLQQISADCKGLNHQVGHSVKQAAEEINASHARSINAIEKVISLSRTTEALIDEKTNTLVANIQRETDSIIGDIAKNDYVMQSFLEGMSQKLDEFAAAQSKLETDLQSALDAEARRSAEAADARMKSNELLSEITQKYVRDLTTLSSMLSADVNEIVDGQKVALQTDCHSRACLEETMREAVNATTTMQAQILNASQSQLQDFQSAVAENRCTLLASSKAIGHTVMSVCESLNKEISDSNKAVVHDMDGLKNNISDSVQKFSDVELAISESLTKSVDQIGEACNSEEVSLGSAVACVSNRCQELETLSHSYLNEKIRRIEKTGTTPKRRHYEIIDEIQYVPRVEELLKENNFNFKARKSAFVTRDSVLHVRNELMSPRTVKHKMIEYESSNGTSSENTSGQEPCISLENNAK